MKRLPEEDHSVERSAARAAAAALRRQSRWVLAAVFAALAITAIVFATVPRRYTAQGSVWLDNRFDALGGTATRRDPAMARNTELRVLASTDLAGGVVDRLGLASAPGFGRPGGDAPVAREEGRRRAIAAVRKGLKVEASGASLVAATRFTAADPDLAAGILNQTMDEYVAFRSTGGERGRRRELLRAQVDTARDEVIRAEAALAALRSAASVIRSPEEAARLRREIATLDEQLAAARGAAGRDDRLRRLRDRRAKLTADRAEIVQREGSATDDLAEVDRELSRVIRDIAAAGEDAPTATRERIARLTSRRAGASAELRAREDAAASLSRRERAAEEARDRYAALLPELRRASPVEQARRGGAHVVARAAVPAAPDFPDPRIFAAIGLIAALIAAALAVVLRELLARGFRGRRHVEAKLGVPVIGMVPDLGKLPGVDRSGGERVEPIDYLFNDPRSPYNAAFRSIHAGLRLGAGAHSPRSVAVSSALPEEGKTTVSVCLARSAALAGLRVVLVDCDGRRPAASRALAAHVEAGLVEVLEGRVSVKEALIRDTPSGAWVLAHSSAGPVSNDLVGSDAMAALIAQLARDFDLIVLDTAPALALAEARSVTAMADSVLLVARWRTTPIQATRIALDMLRQSGAEVVGIALTLVGR